MRYATPRRRHARDLIHDLGCIGEVRGQADPVRQLDDDLEIASRLTRRIDRFLRELNAPLRVDVRPVLLGEGGAGEDHVRITRGLGEEEIMHREKLELAEPRFGVRNVGVRDDGVLAHDVHPMHRTAFLGDLRDLESLP
jgi:hypothetical protein